MYINLIVRDVKKMHTVVDRYRYITTPPPPPPNSTGYNVEVLKWISDFILRFVMV